MRGEKQTCTAGECSREGEGGQTTDMKKKRIVKGGLGREEDENRKHSVCKQQIKNLSALRTKPCPRGDAGLSASYSEQIGKYGLSLASSHLFELLACRNIPSNVDTSLSPCFPQLICFFQSTSR